MKPIKAFPPRVSVVVINPGGRILTEKKHGRKCVLTGGTLRKNESPRAAANREIAEETGLSNIPLLKLVTISSRRREVHYFITILTLSQSRRIKPEPGLRLSWLTMGQFLCSALFPIPRRVKRLLAVLQPEVTAERVRASQ